MRWRREWHPTRRRAASLPDLVSGLLAAAQVHGGAEDVFRFLWRHYHSKFSRAALLLQSAVLPAIAIVGGAIVATVALSVFLPMIRMTDHVGAFPAIRP